MKRTIIFIIILLCTSSFFGETLLGNIKIPFDDSITIIENNTSLNINTKNINQFFLTRFYTVSYCNEKIVLKETILLNQNETSLLKKLGNNKMLQFDYANPSITNLLISKSSQHFENDNNISIKEYICEIGNGWASDYFGFTIKPKDSFYESIDLRFQNIYSTYIEKDGYVSPWNKNKVISYVDQNNFGIQFYYKIEAAIKKLISYEEQFHIYAEVNDDKVRYREEASLSSNIIRNFEKNEKIIVLSCEDESYKIGDDNYPWVKVKTSDNKIGYIYGKYINVFVE